jgi:hypothetical protein
MKTIISKRDKQKLLQTIDKRISLNELDTNARSFYFSDYEEL